MPWAERCQPVRLGPWLLVFTLKGYAHSDQGIALVSWRGIALVFGMAWKTAETPIKTTVGDAPCRLTRPLARPAVTPA